MDVQKARKAIQDGFYSDTMEAEEILGLACQWFPEVDQNRELEEIVADICFN